MEAIDSTIKALEWDRFLTLAEDEARTEPGKHRIQKLLVAEGWAPSERAATQMQQETQEVLQLLDRDALWGPLTGLRDPEPVLEPLERGGVLDVAAFGILRAWLYAVDSWKLVPKEELRAERFRSAVAALADPYEPLRTLDHLLTPEGELSEKASPRLQNLYQEIRGLKREIGVILDRLLKTFSQKGVLQEAFSDVRDGRYVLPVKIASQGDIDGIIYEASVSRQTVFIEPREVGHLNNRLRQRQNDLAQEIHDVLSAASRRLEPFTPELRSSVDVLGHWDAVQAKARTGQRYGGKTIRVTEERFFSLKSTAHPLLWFSLKPEQIVRNDVEFGESCRTLLLTGPNTGGKTVLMKTLGMAGLCARTGFPFPAVGIPDVPFFDSFFADLGDPQSLEQHLSSFSGHVFRFKAILDRLTDRGLVLIDELNSATDPEEGAALGRAFLETLMSRGAMVVTTTHDPHLKAHSIRDDRILTASMAFDEDTRTPTFRMVSGVPGRSRAIETAERLGLQQEVLNLAREYLTREHVEFESLLSRLDQEVRQAASARKDAIRIKEEADQLKREWTERTQAAATEMLDKTRQRLKRVLEQAQDDVRASVRRLDEMKNRREIDLARQSITQAITTASQQTEAALKEEAPEIAAELSAAALAATEVIPPRLEIKPGSSVRIPKWKRTGVVLEIKGSRAKIGIGSMQASFALYELEAIEQTKAEALKAAPKAIIKEEAPPPAPPSQLDIRGMRLEDAMAALERYLDQALRSNAYQEVVIVHGLGTGALREGARKMIAGLPYVKSFQDAGAGRGGSGATIVEFER